MISGLKLVSFDLWDTLIFDERKEPESYTLRRLEAVWKGIPSGLGVGFEDIVNAYNIAKRFKGFLSPVDLVKSILLILGVDPGAVDLESIVAGYEEASGSFVPSMDPSAPSVLEALKKRGLKIMVVSDTSFSASSVRRMLSSIGLDRFIDLVVSSADTGHLKPDPRIFRVGLTTLQVEPWEAIHVGDSCSRDVLGALLTGMKPILLARRTESVNECKNTGAIVIKDLSELPKLIA